jgi:hypothetical protein
VVPRNCLDSCWKFVPTRFRSPERPSRSVVAIPTELTRPTICCNIKNFPANTAELAAQWKFLCARSVPTWQIYRELYLIEITTKVSTRTVVCLVERFWHVSESSLQMSCFFCSSLGKRAIKEWKPGNKLSYSLVVWQPCESSFTHDSRRLPCVFLFVLQSFQVSLIVVWTQSFLCSNPSSCASLTESLLAEFAYLTQAGLAARLFLQVQPLGLALGCREKGFRIYVKKRGVFSFPGRSNRLWSLSISIQLRGGGGRIFPGEKLTIQFHPVLKLRTCETIFSLSHIASWRGYANNTTYSVWHNLYLLLFFSNITCFDQADRRQVFIFYKKFKSKVKM